MTSEGLSALAGLILSLGFAYAPGLRIWFYGVEGDVTKPGLTPDHRRMVMGLLLVAVALVVLGLGCIGMAIDPFQSPLLAGIPSRCGQADFMGLISNLFYALVANQAIYPLLPGLRKVPDAAGEQVK